jgi:glycosyltransferase involved in cell wall biosynthesis
MSDMELPAACEIVVDHWPAARRSLRVAMVTETWPPEVNGVAMTLARVANGLRERNHALQLIRPRQDRADFGDQDGCFHEVLLRGLPIPRYPHLKMGVPSKKRLLELWTLQRPDVVHIATEGPLGWSALQAAAVLKLPVCSDFRTNFHAYSRHYGIGWLHKPIVSYLRKFHNRAHCTMVPTDSLRRDLAAAGFERLRVVARGVDTRTFNPLHRSEGLRRSWGAVDGTRVVLCVGRLAPEKNLGVLLDAFAAMCRIDPQLRLVLVGDGPARKDLQARCPQAVFAGLRHGADLAAHYASADLFLFPSLTETFGNVVPEAMASGLAVLAYDCAAAAQLIRSGDNGLLAMVDSGPAFIERALQLVREPTTAGQLARQARASASRMDWDQIVGLVESEYLTAMEAGPRPQPSGRFLPRPRPG